MEIDKSDFEWLLMVIIMLLQGKPVQININIKMEKPCKKRKRRKHKR